MAFWRGGTGAGVDGETQNLIVRVRGKWFSSGDVGRTGSSRTDFPFVSQGGTLVARRRWKTMRRAVAIQMGRRSPVEMPV